VANAFGSGSYNYKKASPSVSVSGQISTKASNNQLGISHALRSVSIGRDVVHLNLSAHCISLSPSLQKISILHLDSRRHQC